MEGRVTGRLQPLPLACKELPRLPDGCTRYNPGLPRQEEGGQGARTRVTVNLCGNEWQNPGDCFVGSARVFTAIRPRRDCCTLVFKD